MLSGAEPARSEVVISNLTFVSKILERVIDSRITQIVLAWSLLFSQHIVNTVQQKLLLSESTIILLVVLTEVKWVTFTQPSIQ